MQGESREYLSDYYGRLIIVLMEYLEEHNDVMVEEACRMHGISYRMLGKYLKGDLLRIYENLMEQRRRRGRRKLRCQNVKVILESYFKRMVNIEEICKEFGVSYYIFRKSLTEEERKSYESESRKRMGKYRRLRRT